MALLNQFINEEFKKKNIKLLLYQDKIRPYSLLFWLLPPTHKNQFMIHILFINIESAYPCSNYSSSRANGDKPC